MALSYRRWRRRTSSDCAPRGGALAAAAFATWAGCGGALPSPSVIDKLRLLAVTADAPEILPGGSVALRAVWVDGSPRRGARPVYFAWRLCREGLDRDPRSCLRVDRGRDVAAGVGADVVTLGPLDVTLDPGAAATTWQVIVAMCPGSPPAPDAALGQFVCPTEAGTPNEQREGIQAVRRLVVRAAEPLNHNPVIGVLRLGEQDALAAGASLSVPRCPVATEPPCDGVVIRVEAAAGSVERREDGRDETLLTSFFVDAGTVDRPRAVPSEASPLGADGSLSARWRPPSTPGRASVWVVMRDGRGGDVSARFEVEIR